MNVLSALLRAFVVGGLLCLIGQALIDATALTPARILTSYVVAGVVLGALGLYQPLADWAGAGAAVPLTGFGNAIARGVGDLADRKAEGEMTKGRVAKCKSQPVIPSQSSDWCGNPSSFQRETDCHGPLRGLAMTRRCILQRALLFSVWFSPGKTAGQRRGSRSPRPPARHGGCAP